MKRKINTNNFIWNNGKCVCIGNDATTKTKQLHRNCCMRERNVRSLATKKLRLYVSVPHALCAAPVPLDRSVTSVQVI